MKKILIIITILTISLSFLSGCSDTVATKITFQNFASNKVYINFRASLIPVNSGESVELRDVPKGTYVYETTYEIPFGTNSSVVVGDVSGEVELAAGTKILIVYASTFNDFIYTISATKTSTDDLSDDGGIDPIGP